ncbi:hypothetical protein D1AOALGA4SA_5886 [Olavius algarvensis Delta 1 endosymbiont]|nr:hypothetical protein D1AOALGA4SA_5886 [Olavius algarvensis Delta 1 endosymbiont]
MKAWLNGAGRGKSTRLPSRFQKANIEYRTRIDEFRSKVFYRIL